MAKRTPTLSRIIFLLLFAMGIAYFFTAHYGRQNFPFEEPKSKGPASSFLLLRVPEITSQHESGVETMKKRLDEWLEAVVSSGFQPMLLTEAVYRLERGYGLPDRTVVLSFSPGYRKTYEVVGPIFARRRFPAVWLTNGTALERSDRRYLTYHDTRGMKASGLWDVGFMDARQNFSIDSGRYGKPLSLKLRWFATAGALALNRAGGLKELNFLNVNADWNAQELVSRLRAECPPCGKVYLSKGVIHSKEWGTVMPEGEAGAARFDLQAALNNRGAKLFWLGTQGRGDSHIELSVGSLIGELWLQLGFDEITGDDTHLIMSDRELAIESRSGHRYKRLQTVQLERSFLEGPFSLGVTRQGSALSVSLDGRTIDTAIPAASAAGRGVVQLFLTDRARGVARANGMLISFTPLGGGEKTMKPDKQGRK